MAYSRRLVIFFNFCALASFLFGAESTPTAQITAIWADGRRSVGEYFINDPKGQPQKLVVGVSSRGAPLSVGSVGQPIIILRKTPVVAAGGVAGYEPAGEIAWPSGGSRRLLLLLAAGSPTSKTIAPSIKGVALADDFSVFPIGNLRVTSFLGSDIFGRIGDNVRTITPGTSPSIPYPVSPLSEGEKKIQNFALGFARSLEGGRKDRFYNGRVDAWPHSRILVLIFPGATIDSDPIVRTILDVIPPTPVIPAGGKNR